jgi:regulator of sirC expression with transglutaminase-like and TPR domain
MGAIARTQLLDCADRDGDVAEGALWLAAEDCGDVDVPGSLRFLDELADELRTRRGAAADGSPVTVVPVLGALLRDRLRLRGAAGEDPRTHWLHTVMERGLGIPIACSVLWIAVGRRAGVPVDGVGLPGHFVVRVGSSLVDAHAGGQLLDTDGARGLVASSLGGDPGELREEWLRPTSTRDVLVRMSRNLRACHLRRGELRSAFQAADRCVALLPNDPGARQERAEILLRAGAVPAAIADLRACLASAAPGADTAGVETLLAQARALAN